MAWLLWSLVSVLDSETELPSGAPRALNHRDTALIKASSRSIFLSQEPGFQHLWHLPWFKKRILMTHVLHTRSTSQSG